MVDDCEVIEEQRTVDSGQWTEDGGRWTVDGGRWTVDGGRWTVDGGRWRDVRRRQLKKTQIPLLNRGGDGYFAPVYGRKNNRGW